ncbi:hypothetical protein SBV1_2050019 [Verrucomicrobia bacterium]|nr:hypothetical protein SBV1_2050019 [Verrucomicrobiota bacterium]
MLGVGELPRGIVSGVREGGGRRYKPEQILLPNAPLGSEWKEFLASGYGVAQSDKDFVLYVEKSILR